MLGGFCRRTRLDDETHRDLGQLVILGDQQLQSVLETEAMKVRQLERAEGLGGRRA